MLRSLIIASAVAAIALLPTTASATVVVTDESRAQVHVMDQLEQGIRARFGHAAAREARDAYGFIWVGISSGPALPTWRGRPTPAPPAKRPMLLMKDVTGWYGWHSGRRARLSKAVAQELDSILIGEEVWAETSSPLAKSCPAGDARILYARHAGRDLVRRDCSVRGLVGRLGQVAATGRVSGMSPVRATPHRIEALGADRGLFRHLFDRSDLMAASWERGDLTGYLEPYAEDVVIVRADRTIRGREALISFTRGAREWRMGAAPPMRLQSTSFAPQVGDTIVQTREYRFEKDGREMKRTVTAHWRSRGGLWQIVREEVGRDLPA